MKMKRIIALLLVLALGTSLFGCYNPYASRHNKKDRNSKHERNVDEDDDGDDDEEEETTTTTSETTTSETTTASTESPSTTTPQSYDLDFDVVEATLSHPAGLNEWFRIMTYNPTDRQYHVAFARITGVYDNATSQTYIDEYLATHTYYTLAEIEYDDVEYRCFTYEVYFPEDTPVESWGVSNLTIDAGICNPTASSTFVGTSGNSYFLSSAWDISNEEVDIPAGGVFSGVGIFGMTVGCDEFYINVDIYDGTNFDYAYANPFA